MRITVLIFISLIFLSQVAAAQTTYTIEVNESGNAMWTVEKRVSLTTTEINEWEGIIKKGQNITKQQAVIKTEMDGLLRSAQNFSNRSMEIEKLNISYDTIKTLNGGFGVIRYGFEWNNFSRTDSGMIYIGDVFSGGDVLPSDITLIIKIPSGYYVQNVSPEPDKRDGNRLIWGGATNPVFSKGEPSLVLSRTIINKSTWPIVVVPIVVLISGALLGLWKRKHLLAYIRRNDTVLAYNSGNGASEIDNTATDAARADNTGTNAVQIDMMGASTAKMDTTGVRVDSTDSNLTSTGAAGTETTQTDDTGTSTTQADSREIKATLMGNAGISIAETGSSEINAVQTDNIRSEMAYAQLPDLMAEILGDEEMIEQYLIKRGGQAFQSEIVKESGLSKSKISIVLAKMKDDGRVLKIRKGKENIIRLVVKK